VKGRILQKITFKQNKHRNVNLTVNSLVTVLIKLFDSQVQFRPLEQ